MPRFTIQMLDDHQTGVRVVTQQVWDRYGQQSLGHDAARDGLRLLILDPHHIRPTRPTWHDDSKQPISAETLAVIETIRALD